MTLNVQKMIFDPIIEMTKKPTNSVKDIIQTIPNKILDNQNDSENYIILKLSHYKCIMPYSDENIKAAKILMDQAVSYIDTSDGILLRDGRYGPSDNMIEISIKHISKNDLKI